MSAYEKVQIAAGILLIVLFSLFILLFSTGLRADSAPYCFNQGDVTICVNQDGSTSSVGANNDSTQ